MIRRAIQRWQRCRRRFVADERGLSTIEYTLLLAAVAIPFYAIILVLLDLMIDHYQMTTFMNCWPFP